MESLLSQFFSRFIIRTPFNGLGTHPDIENPPDGLRQARLVPILESSGHIVTDLGDLIGFKCAVKEGLESFAQRELPTWLHFDVDVLDPDVMPVMFPEPGGLNFEETQNFLNPVWNSSQIDGLSIACYHPRLDTDGSAGKRLVTLISEVLSPLANT
jgi:hypothetical protein